MEPATDQLSGEIARFAPRLRAFAHSLGNDDTDAEDLVQETCLRAIGARDRFVPGTSLKAWLFTIMRNLHLNRRRDAAARPQLVTLEDAGIEHLAFNRALHAVEVKVLARAELTDVACAFRSLPPAFAIPLHLVAVEDLSYAQVASILEIPIGTVMSRIYRGRRLLLSQLTDDLE